MMQQDFIMLIMNCKKYVKKAKYQKMTWIQQIPNYLKYFHVIGDPDLETEYELDESKNMLLIKVDDDYNSLPKKVIRAYKAISNAYNFKYLFKTDDDQILINIGFLDILKNILDKTDETHYGGFIIDIKQSHLSQYHKIHPELPAHLPILQTKYCSGRFYFLSNKVVIDILNKQNLIENEYFEDYAIGYHMNSNLKENMLNLATNKFFIDIELTDFSQLVEKNKI